MIDRCSQHGSKKDTVLICEGAEGEGKTTLSVAIAYYVSEKTGREFNESKLFFDVNKMIEYAQSTERQIIIWDEPALQALSTDWASSAVKNLTRLLMMARKKQHFIIINMTKFYKFNEYIVVDRPMALIHVYSRRNIQSGRFMYIRKKYLENLWRDYRFRKRRNYHKYCSKHIRGMFPDVLNPKYKYNVVKEFNIVDYEKKKDEAIMEIGKDTKVDKKVKWKTETLVNLEINNPNMTQAEQSKILGVSTKTIQRYRATPLYETLKLETLNNNNGIKVVPTEKTAAPLVKNV